MIFEGRRYLEIKTATQSSHVDLGAYDMPFHNLVPVLLLAAVISLHAAHPAAAASNTTSTVTLIVGAGGCTGHSWGENGSKFGYSVLLTQLNVTGTCNATNVRISKLYIDGACASSRDNSLSCVPDPFASAPIKKPSTPDLLRPVCVWLAHDSSDLCPYTPRHAVVGGTCVPLKNGSLCIV